NRKAHRRAPRALCGKSRLLHRYHDSRLPYSRFVHRESRGGQLAVLRVARQILNAATQRDAICERLVAGDALILFPEGTSGDGNRPLPFKTALFGAAEKRGNVRPVVVQPVSLAYTRLDGIPIGRSFRPFFSWYGAMGLVPHLWRM